MSKKILILFLACAMSFSYINTAVAANEQNAAINEVITNEDVITVKNLGIMIGYEDGSFRENNEVTRMEFVAVITKILGCDDLASAYEDCKFFDVPQDSWGRGYIGFAYNMGLIEGYSDDEFGPEDSVTGNQAVKIILNAMGYKEISQMKGGYPNGYIAQAVRLGILDNVRTGERAMTRGEVASLVANCLDVNFAEVQSVNSKGEVTLENNGDTILKRMSYKKGEGIITNAYGFISETKKGALKNNELIINDEIYQTTLEDISGFILKRVEYYYKESESGKNVISYIKLKKNNGEDLVVESDDILSDTTLSEFIYLSNGKKRTIDLPGSIAIIYNGKPASTAEISAKLLVPEEGNVTFIDTDRDGRYDYAVVNEYENHVVEITDLPYIYDKYGKSLKLDEDDDVAYCVYFNNKRCSEREIKKGDVLSVKKSFDAKNMRVDICRSVITGFIDEIESEGGRILSYTINGDEYKLAHNYSDAYLNSNPKLKKLGLNDSAEFYLDIFGKIASSNPVELKSDGEYGYFIEAGAKNSLSPTFELKIMTVENKFETFKCAKKITFGRMQGGAYKIDRANTSAMLSSLLSDDTEMQMVKYSLNSEGEINKLYFADTNRFSGNFSLDVESNSRYYANGVMDNKYTFKTDTNWFDIPEGGVYSDLFSAGFAPDFLKSGDSYLVEFYDVENDIPSAVVCRSNAARFLTYESKVIVDDANSPIMFVDAVKVRTINGEEKTCVEGYVDGEYISMPVSDTLREQSKTFKDIKPGTIIQYETNYAERGRAETSDDEEVIWVYNVLHDFKINSGDYYQYWNNTRIRSNNASLSTIYGVVNDTDFPFIKVLTKDENFNDVETTLQLGTQTITYVYDNNNKTWEKSDQRNVQRGKVIFVRVRYNKIREIVIFKE